ncbi:MAG: SDR family oxidoreductase [Alphaproteobacteria bacterium]
MAESTAPAALVTGAGRRIGRAIALALAEDGYAVAVHYDRSRVEALAVVEGIRARGGRAEALEADLADPAAVGGLVPRAGDALGPLGVLVNNASLFERDLLSSVTPASWRAHLAVNLEAPVFLTQAFARQLPASTTGNVVNMIDQKVLNLSPFYLSYTAAKAALWALTQTLALELAPTIRVNAIGPGPTLPNAIQSEADFERYARSMPLGRGVALDDVTRTVRYILATPALTGHLIPIDGGEHLGWATPKSWRAAREQG